MPLFCRKGANVCCFSAVRAHVEQSDDAGAGMGADDRANMVEHETLDGNFLSDHVGQQAGLVLAVAVGDVDGLLFGVGDGFLQLILQGGDGGLAAADGTDFDKTALVVHVENGLDLQHGAHHGGGLAYPAAALQADRLR